MELFSFSNLWTSFTNRALDDGPAAVIIVSDYDADDAGQASAAKLRLTRAQIPILAITPVKVKEEVLSDLLTVSGAQRFAVTDPKLKTALRDVVAKATTTKRAYSYRFHYKADLEGPNPRTVHITLTSHPQIRTSATYQVPAQEVRVPPASVAGLYLTILVGGQRERRHLGGVRFNEGGYTKDDPNNAALIAEARNALNGMVTVTVEPGSPTMGAVLEDVVTSFQSLEPLLKNKDDEQAFMAAAGRFYRYPLELAQLLAPQPASDRDEAVVSQGLRILVSTEQPEGEGVVSRIDIPPGLNRMRFVRGGTSGVPSVVRASLWFSVNESLAYEESAFTQLHGRPLHLIVPYESVPNSVLEKFSPDNAIQVQRVAAQYEGGYIRLVPTDGGTVAMWVVDPATGTVMAIDETGRGGGVHDIVVGLQTLGALLFMAISAGCEAHGGPAFRAFYCMGIAVTAIATTAETLLIEYKTSELHMGWPLVAEGALGVLHGWTAIEHKFLFHASKDVSIKAGNVVLLILGCMAYVVANFHFLNEMIDAYRPSGARPGTPRE